MMVGAYLDVNLCDKIKRGEYVDFARLLPRDKDKFQENKLELVYRNGQTFFVPAHDREATGIFNFNKWEQAFRVYSNVYLQEHPDCAAELIQYNHIIFSAENPFTWDNVYQYDKEFRMHLSSFPERSWALFCNRLGLCASRIACQITILQNNTMDPKTRRKYAKDLTKVCVPLGKAANLTIDAWVVVNLAMEFTFAGIEGLPAMERLVQQLLLQ